MTQRAEAQAAFDHYVETHSQLTLTDFTVRAANAYGNAIANLMADELFPRLERMSELDGETAVAMASALYAVADFASKLVELTISQTQELGGDELIVSGQPSWLRFVATTQEAIDAIPDEEEDEETKAILADADAMAAIEEAESEEVSTD